MTLPFADDTFDAVATSPAYGNRMADRTVRPAATTHSYAHSLGRLLSPGSGASLQWNRGYQELHQRAAAEIVRVVRPGGLILVNMKDHPRGFEHQHVTDWWITTMTDAGAVLIDRHPVNSGGIPHGANRAPMSEYVLVHEVTP